MPPSHRIGEARKNSVENNYLSEFPSTRMTRKVLVSQAKTLATLLIISTGLWQSSVVPSPIPLSSFLPHPHKLPSVLIAMV